MKTRQLLDQFNKLKKCNQIFERHPRLEQLGIEQLESEKQSLEKKKEAIEKSIDDIDTEFQQWTPCKKINALAFMAMLLGTTWAKTATNNGTIDADSFHALAILLILISGSATAAVSTLYLAAEGDRLAEKRKWKNTAESRATNEIEDINELITIEQEIEHAPSTAQSRSLSSTLFKAKTSRQQTSSARYNTRASARLP